MKIKLIKWSHKIIIKKEPYKLYDVQNYLALYFLHNYMYMHLQFYLIIFEQVL